MCRIDEQDFPIDPRQLTLEEWQNFKRRVTERAQQDRQQVLRAAAIALPRALLVRQAASDIRADSPLKLTLIQLLRGSA